MKTEAREGPPIPTGLPSVDHRGLRAGPQGLEPRRGHVADQSGRVQRLRKKWTQPGGRPRAPECGRCQHRFGIPFWLCFGGWGTIWVLTHSFVEPQQTDGTRMRKIVSSHRAVERRPHTCPRWGMVTSPLLALPLPKASRFLHFNINCLVLLCVCVCFFEACALKAYTFGPRRGQHPSSKSNSPLVESEGLQSKHDLLRF